MLKIIIIPILFLILLVVSSLFFNDGTYNLGEGYEFFEDNRFIAAPFKDRNAKDIPPYVINYNHNRRFIIAKQNPNGRYPDRIFYDDFVGDSVVYNPDKYTFPNGLNCDYYWIIDKKEHKQYGPLSIGEFNNKCDSLEIRLSFDPTKEHKLKQ